MKNLILGLSLFVCFAVGANELIKQGTQKIEVSVSYITKKVEVACVAYYHPQYEEVDDPEMYIVNSKDYFASRELEKKGYSLQYTFVGGDQCHYGSENVVTVNQFAKKEEIVEAIKEQKAAFKAELIYINYNGALDKVKKAQDKLFSDLVNSKL